MPFVGRDDAIATAWEATVAHFKSRTPPYERGSHARLFAVGAPGIGKTRFGAEFDKLLLEYGRKHFPKEQPELLQKLSKNLIYIPITFASGNTFDTLDDKYSEPHRVDWILTSRAIYQAFDIKEKFNMFASKLSEKLGPTLPSDFNLNSLSEYLIKRFNPSALYWHLDEINAIISKSDDLVVLSIKKLSQLFIESNVFTLLLFTGTVYQQITDAITRKTSWSPEAPPLQLPLEFLSDESIEKLLDTMHTGKKLPWLDDNWKLNQPFRRLLADTGGVPRIIQLLLERCQERKLNHLSEANIADLEDELTSKISFRYSLTDNTVLVEAICLALSGLEYRCTHTLLCDNRVTLEELRSKGYMFLRRGESEFVPLMPFIFLRAEKSFWNVYGLQPFWSKIWNPTQQLSWEEFEIFTLYHQILRTKSLLYLGMTSIPLRTYFSKASTFHLNSRLNKAALELQRRKYVELEHQWPDNTNRPWPTSANFDAAKDNLFDYVFLNASAASFDGFEFIKLKNTDRVLIMAYQNKFTKKGKTKLTADSVSKELVKIHDALDKLKQNKSNPSELNELLQRVEIFTIIFTNRAIENNLEQQLKQNPNYKSSYQFAIVSNMDYFGPLASAITSFNTTEN